MSERLVTGEITRYGFTCGPMTVERLMTDPNGGVVIGIKANGGKEIQVYVSGKGRSLRVFTPGRGEWVPAGDEGGTGR